MKNKSEYKNNTSGYRGVTPNKGRGKPWYAVISVNGKTEHLGAFDCPKEAAEVYQTRARELNYKRRKK